MSSTLDKIIGASMLALSLSGMVKASADTIPDTDTSPMQVGVYAIEYPSAILNPWWHKNCVQDDGLIVPTDVCLEKGEDLSKFAKTEGATK